MAPQIRVDCHVHTCFSNDCRMSFESLIASAQKRGISCLAVTDHNTIAGAVRLQEISPFKVIVGEEIKTSSGEIIGYFLQEEIPAGLTAQETVKRIKEQGGLVCVPHPFDRLRKSAIKIEALTCIVNDIDIVEVFNSRNVFDADDKAAMAFARKHSKAVSVGSDCHSQYEVGQCYVEIEDFNNPRDFLDKLKQGTLICQRSTMAVHMITKWNKFAHKFGL